MLQTSRLAFLLAGLCLAACQATASTPLPNPAIVVAQSTTEAPTSTALHTIAVSPTATAEPSATFIPTATTIVATLTPIVATPNAVAASPAEAAEVRVIELTNAQRLSAGLAALVSDPALMSIARERAADMAARDYFGHTDPVTGERLARKRAAEAGFTGRVGENIYWSGSPLADFPSEAVGWFMDDEPHAANILKPEFAFIGVGIAPGANDTWILSQVFASP